MRLMIAAIGRLKDAERDLIERYAERLDAAGRGLKLGPLQISEIPEGRAATPQLRKADETQRLLKAAAAADVTVALDEGGRALSSASFASLLAKERDGGARTLAFLI